MIEMLTGSLAKPRPRYPWSGPGTKTLTSGDETLGYFGQVTSFDMGITESLIQLVINTPGITGLSAIKEANWFKVMRGGKVLFFPDGPIAVTNYVDLEALKMTFNANGAAGTIPGILPFSGQPMYKENAIARANDKTAFRVRLSRSASIPTGANPSTPVANIAGSEVYETIMGISAQWSGVPNRLTGAKVNFSKHGLTTSVGLSWMAESTAATAARVFGTVSSSTTVYGANATTATDFHWFPILEVIPPTEMDTVLAPLTNFLITSTDTPESPSFTTDVHNQLSPVSALLIIDTGEETLDLIKSHGAYAPTGFFGGGQLPSGRLTPISQSYTEQVFGAGQRTTGSMTPTSQG